MALVVAVGFNVELGVAITGYAKPVPNLSIDSCYAFITLSEGPKKVF